MNRSAPRGPLQSGCFAAWARGFHHLPSRSGLFRKAGFVTAFRLSNRDIISCLLDLSSRVLPFFGRFLPLYHNALPGAGALAATAAGDGPAFIRVDPIPDPSGTSQYQRQQKPSQPCHPEHLLVLFKSITGMVFQSVAFATDINPIEAEGLLPAQADYPVGDPAAQAFCHQGVEAFAGCTAQVLPGWTASDCPCWTGRR